VWHTEAGLGLYVLSNTTITTSHQNLVRQLTNQHRHQLVGSTDLRDQTGQWHRPQIWAVVSTPILDILQEASYGATFKLAISGNSISFMGYSFVDDTDLVQTGPCITSTSQELLPLMQAALLLWEQGLQATGGTLVPSKSFWYHIDF